MTKKKKKTEKSEEGEDVPGTGNRLAELKSIIDDHIQTHEREEEFSKTTMHPLKRVNSNPLVYDFVPMAKSLFPDSQSVDYGYNGTVDIPNQVFYKEEIPNDLIKIDKTLKPSGPGVTASLSFMNNNDVDDHETGLLKSLKHLSTTDFLKRRVGPKNMEAILETMKSFTILPKRDDTFSGGARRFLPDTTTAEGKRRMGCGVVILVLLIIVGALLGLASAGVYIPFLTDALFPVDTGKAGNETTTFETTAPTVTKPAGESISLVGEGSSAIQYRPLPGSELTITDIDILNIDGEPLNTTFEYGVPPPYRDDRVTIVKDLYRKVYEHMGFKVTHSIVDDIRPLPDLNRWRVRTRVFGRAKFNLGVMYWYGYDPLKSQEYESEYSLRIRAYATELFSTLCNSEVIFIDSFVGPSFPPDAKRYLNKIHITRPPDHVPDKWGDCTGSEVCPYMNLQ